MMPYSSEHRSSKERERKGAKKSCKTRRFCGGLALLRAPYTNSAFTTELSLIWEGWCDFKHDTKIGEALLSILMQAFVSRRNIDVLTLLVWWLLRSLQRLADPAADHFREEVLRPMVRHLAPHHLGQISRYRQASGLRPLLHFFRHVVRKVQVQLSHSKYILDISFEARSLPPTSQSLASG